MKKIFRTIISTGAIALSLGMLVGCGGTTPSASSSSIRTEPYTAADPRIVELTTMDQERIELTGPFTIYSETGEEVTLKKNENGQISNQPVESTYDNMYKAIRVAGANATNRNPLQVQDANFTQIFLRSKKSDAYVFTEHDYIGKCLESKAKAFCDENPKSYAINGLGSDYHYMSRDDYDETREVTSNLETYSGAYNYMFSKLGDNENNGFGYATAYVRLSETIYAPPTDGGQWNAYIFINLAGNFHADLGLIGTYNWYTNVCTWKMFRSCDSKKHPGVATGIEDETKFFVYQDKPVTSSKHYDPETRECTGFDDLFFEMFMRTDGWVVNITNLTTNVVSTFSCLHEENGKPYEENVHPMYGRALLAASYCPVTAPVWNWDCGAKLLNVVFEDVLLTRKLDGENLNNIEAYRDESLTRYEFYPDSEVFDHGYSQGDFRANYEYGTRETSGYYKSGAPYSAGDKYLIYNIDYND